MIEDTKRILERFTALEGVTLAMVAGTDGLVIESVSKREYDIDAIAAVATTGLGASEVLSREVGQGELIQSIIEFEKGIVILQPIGDLGILLALSESSASIGRIRLVARRERQALLEALQA